MIYLALIASFLTGIFISILFFKALKRPVGTLLIDEKSEDKDLYLFEIKDLDAIKNHKYILLKVNPKADIPKDSRD